MTKSNCRLIAKFVIVLASLLSLATHLYADQCPYTANSTPVELMAYLTGRGSSGRFSAKRAAQPGKRLFDVRGDGRGDTAATTSLLTISVPEQPK